MLTLFISAFLLGLVFNAAPGAVFAETVRQGARGGFRPAFAVQVGSLTGDALWAVLGLLGVGLVLKLRWLQLPIGLAGAAYLVWLAVDAWRQAGREFVVAPAAGGSSRRALKAGVTLSVTNPQNLAYWAAVGSAMGAVGVSDPTPQDYTTFFCGFMLSSLVWAFFCAYAVGALFARLGDGWARLTYRLCAAAFLALALGSMRDLAAHWRAEASAPPAAVSTDR
ncbi:LysE family translocator [Rhizobacter sp. LjRoot28]|jgi:chemosensory pili system protein ChpE/L-lysine exporter family protein LysE/ArgO|uniref:LysE family translocator n=1 Tax=Rhizobacter sp. LjRoot28 TaxID=3342309 RepID=UPI003ECFBE0A